MTYREECSCPSFVPRPRQPWIPHLFSRLRFSSDCTQFWWDILSTMAASSASSVFWWPPHPHQNLLMTTFWSTFLSDAHLSSLRKFVSVTAAYWSASILDSQIFVPVGAVQKHPSLPPPIRQVSSFYERSLWLFLCLILSRSSTLYHNSETAVSSIAQRTVHSTHMLVSCDTHFATNCMVAIRCANCFPLLR